MKAAIVFLLAMATLPARAQECVSCRSDKCKAMFWVQPCEVAAPEKPVKEDKAPEKLCQPGQKLELHVDFPPQLTEGELIGIRIRANCRAYLIVYYVEDGGPGAVLWPSELERAPFAEPERPASLLSAREMKAGQRLQAQLRTAGEAAHETFHVFAVADKAQFERLKPAAGTTRPDGKALAAGLAKKLARLPAGSWAQFAAHYSIEPGK